MCKSFTFEALLLNVYTAMRGFASCSDHVVIDQGLCIIPVSKTRSLHCNA
jgi:hypothetical protein